jgi:hypothetical protein
MPIHLDDLDITSQVAGMSSALIVPCNMCPAVTLSVREEKPFIQFFRTFLKSPPFDRYIRDLQTQLQQQGVETSVFRSPLPHQWFLCMWPAGRRKRLRKAATQYDAVVVLGCDTAAETVRDAVDSSACRVIEGMKVTGFMNAKMTVRWPCDVCFEDCKLVPIRGTNEKDERRPKSSGH